MNGEADRTAALAPRANPELLGQGAAEAVLLQASETGRLPHAWLLTGPRGVGKATLAYRFARYLLARAGAFDDAEPGLFAAPPPPAKDLALAPDHPVFRRIASGGHPDFKLLEPGVNEKTGKPRTEITVDQVRKATEFLHLTPAEGGWRIVLVDSADVLNANAANALLKILEEPSPQSLLLLVSHAPGRLLPTVRSRCCHLTLRPLPDDTVIRLLQRHLTDLSEEDARTLADLGEGSIGRALELAEVGGLELYGELIGLLAGVAGPAAHGFDVERLHGFADRLSRGTDLGAFRAGRDLLLSWLARAVRHRSLAAVAGERPAQTDETDALAADFARRGSLAEWLALWDKVAHLLARVESANLDRKQTLLAVFLELEALARAE